jgi:hypothetical protein
MFFFYRKRFGQEGLSFDEFLNRGAFPIDNPKYRIKGAVVVDYIGRYESRSDELTAICRRLALPPPVDLPRAKGQYRGDHKPYWDFYTGAHRDLVAEKYAWEISHFGYEFGAT